jgi:hypothetical protein
LTKEEREAAKDEKEAQKAKIIIEKGLVEKLKNVEE